MRKDIKTALGFAVAAAMLMAPVLANADDSDGTQPQKDEISQAAMPAQTNQNQKLPTQTAATPGQKTQKPQSQNQSTAKKSTSTIASASTASKPATTSAKPAPSVGPQNESPCSDSGATQGNLAGGSWELSTASGTCTLTINAESGQEVQIPNDFFRNMYTTGHSMYTDVDFAGKTQLPADSSNLFNGIHGLKHLHHTDNVDASRVTNMSQMFNDSDFGELDLSGWDVSNVTQADAFSNLHSCRSLNLGGWKLNSLQSTSGLVNAGDSLETLILDDISAPQLTSLGSLITDAPNLKTVNMRNFSAASATDIRHLFDSPRQSLEKIDMSHATFPNATNLMGLFSERPKLTTLDISYFSAPKAMDMSYLFENLYALKNLNIFKLDTKNVTNMSHMFDNCTSLTSVDLSSWDTESVQEMSAMFRQCQHVASIDLSNWDTRNVTMMDRLFTGDDKLAVVDLSTFTTTNNTYMNNLFEGDTAIKQISIGPHTQLSGWQPALFASFNEPYTGKWVKVYQPGSPLTAEKAAQTYDWSDIQNESTTNTAQAAGTYVWQENRTLTLQPGTPLPAGTHIGDTAAKQYQLIGGHATSIHIDGQSAPQDASTLTMTLPDSPYKLLDADESNAKGYTFKWNTAADGSGTAYDAADVFDLANGNVTLYATWKVTPKPQPKPQPSKPAKPAKKPNKPTQKPSKPVQKPSKPTQKPSKPVQKPSKPASPSATAAHSQTRPENKPNKPYNHKAHAASSKTGVMVITPSVSGPGAPAAQAHSPAQTTGSARRTTATSNPRGIFGLTVAGPQLQMPNDRSLGNGNNASKNASPKKRIPEGCEPIAYLQGSASPVIYRCDTQDTAASSAVAQSDSTGAVAIWLYVLLIAIAIGAMVYTYERRNSMTISSQHRAY
ncbi:BspA family leucine-rich repeat surface protein [Bifidobacterium sp. ESL0728]|uniref:BspA family leucine-rich repeat surface protein n=1 Tax=Bifidobacterium sp. ESL0728 TaxID=2983220 RepID=UPI0023F96298|nr:BspA family leucine-rich repeat surface protein [Bifidobacterium sp. ESL0728]WEV59198.1 BspA family leucine-rich repeat surface protein [Bifidobacterium sp. ESL0728]